jgi:hypothetical protein
MNNTNDGSNIRVDMLSNASILTLLEGVKNKQNLLEWTKIIHDLQKGSADVISATSLINSVSVYQSGHTNAAIELFLVVNDKTKVDDEEKLIKGIKTMKTFIVYYGTQSPSKLWYCLATDKNHFLNLNNGLDADIESFFVL